MKVRFYLRNERNRKGESLIMACYSHGSKDWRFSTGIRIDPKQWNQRKQRIKETDYITRVLNTEKLDRIEQELQRIAWELSAQDIPPTAQEVRLRFGRKSKAASFWECWDEFYETKVQNLAKNTQLNYNRLRDILKEMEDYTGKPMTWSGFDLSFYEQFKTFLERNGNNVNTVSKRISQLKSFLRYAHKNRWHSNDAYQFFEAKRTDGLHVALSEEDIHAFESVELPHPYQQRARDLFIFQMNLGVRYSDLASFKPESADGRILKFTQVKTGKYQELGMNAKAWEIWQKYEGKLPVISDQKYREYTKEVCRLAGINQMVMTSKGRVPKYQAVATHTARRTLATRLHRKGVSLKDICDVLGHSSVKQTEKYIKTTLVDTHFTLDVLD